MTSKVKNYRNPDKDYIQNVTWAFKLDVLIEEFEFAANLPPYFDETEITLPLTIEAELNTTIPDVLLPPMKDSNSTQKVKLSLNSESS